MNEADPYLRYTSSVEQKEPDEDAMIEQIVAAMGKASRLVFDKHRHGYRDAHAKSHGILRGELRVMENLPPHLSQGLFQAACVYPIIVRFSNAPGDVRPDSLHSQRGMAVKVIGVEGERALADGFTTQDFLMVNYPTLPFGTVSGYFKLRELIENNPHKTDAELASVGQKARMVAGVLNAFGRKLPAPIEMLSAANTHPLGETYHSMAPLRYGDYLGKISAAPLSENIRVLTGQAVDFSEQGSSQIRDLLVEFFRGNAADFQLRVQLCTSLTEMPVEDASVRWPETLSPQQPIATIHLPVQDAYSDQRRNYADDVLSFSPWHALAAHRPLGGLMRSRLRAYEASSQFRHQVNGIAPVEPSSIDELPE